MGPCFRDCHCDGFNACQFHTANTVAGDMPKSYYPRNSFILGLGVFVRLDKYVMVNFSGRQCHGSTPPLAPRGEKPVAWAYRLTVVSYPPERMTDSSSCFPVGALPNGKPFSVPPEAVMLMYVIGLLFPW